MVITVDKSSSEPIYLQIRSKVIAAIAQGDLVEGDSLPSVRGLARDLGVNLHTANKAYAVLQDEGYVRMNGRKGTTVCLPSYPANSKQRTEAQQRTLDVLQRAFVEFTACGGTEDEFVKLAKTAAGSQGEE